MTWFPEEKDEEAIAYAKQIRDAINKKRLGRAGSIEGWIRVLSLMKRANGPLLIKVIAWYVEHIGDEFVPIARSGDTFKLKFKQIKDAMEREPPKAQASFWARQVVESILREGREFPIEIRSVLPILVDRTELRWEEFCAKLDGWIATGQGGFVGRVTCFHSHTFVMEWFRLISMTYGHMEHYTGNVAKLAFTPQSKMFRESFWHKWSMNWCGCPTTFDSLLEEVLKK